MSEFDAFSALYERGVAYGASNIKTDTMIFKFKGQKFEFPTVKVHALTYFNGYFYEAKIDDLRRLEREAAGG